MEGVASLLGLSDSRDATVEIDSGELSNEVDSVSRWDDAIYKEVNSALENIPLDSFRRKDGSIMKSIVSKLLTISHSTHDLNCQIQCMNCCLHFFTYPNANAYGITPLLLFHELSQVLRRIVQFQVNVFEGRSTNAVIATSAEDDICEHTQTEGNTGLDNTDTVSFLPSLLLKLLSHLLHVLQRSHFSNSLF